MIFSSLTGRLDTDSSQAWAIHDEGRRRLQAGEDVILLSVGDPDFDTPAAIVDHAAQQMRAGRTRYGPAAGDRALREAIAGHHFRVSGQRVDPDCVVVFPGAQNALFAAMLCVAGPGDEVIVPEPSYVTYDGVVATAGATRIQVPLSPEKGFHLDAGDFAGLVNERTRAVLLNTPHNPTGSMLSSDELEGIGALARQRDLWVVSDEVYAELSYGPPHVSMASLEGMAERTVTISSMSKSHAMQGWRLGWAVAPPELAHHMINLIMCMLFGMPPFTQDAALYALTHRFEELEHMKAEYRRRRDLVSKRLNQCPGLRCGWPDGGMFVLLDVRETGLDDTGFAHALLDAEGVCLLPAASFGPSAAGHVRISLTAALDDLDTACDRIQRFSRSLAAS